MVDSAAPSVRDCPRQAQQIVAIFGTLWMMLVWLRILNGTPLGEALPRWPRLHSDICPVPVICCSTGTGALYIYNLSSFARGVRKRGPHCLSSAARVAKLAPTFQLVAYPQTTARLAGPLFRPLRPNGKRRDARRAMIPPTHRPRGAQVPGRPRARPRLLGAFDARHFLRRLRTAPSSKMCKRPPAIATQAPPSSMIGPMQS